LAFVKSLLKLRRDTGSVAPRPRGGGRQPSLDAAGKEALVEMVKASPDATLEELQTEIERQVGVSMSVSAVCRTLGKLNLPRKKSHFMPRSEKANESRH
jgi:transposase